MVKQGDKYYWDLDGIHTTLPTMMEGVKILVGTDTLTLHECRKLSRAEMVKQIRDKLNNSHRYMEVPRWMTFGRTGF